jgi:hypothetical protein
MFGPAAAGRRKFLGAYQVLTATGVLAVTVPYFFPDFPFLLPSGLEFI